MIIALIAAASIAQASTEGRLMRFPDVYNDTIAFTYAGDIWLVPLEGGIARKVTSHAGNEYISKFSPDGKWIAFSASYDGNTDVYVMPSEGGEPKRLTYHPGPDIVLDWTPDGKSVIFRSPREAVTGRYLGAFSVPAAGGTPEALPMQETGLASPSPDGTKYAYNRMPTENAAWKRYRGGLQSFISFYDLKTNRYWEMDRDNSAYLWPMWVDNRVFYANDSDGTYNLYSYDVNTKARKKLTNFKDFDMKWPSYGTGKIVYEQDGKLWTYDVSSGAIKNVPVRILSDLVDTRPYRLGVGNQIRDFSLSPNGVRVATEARGELFSVPVKEGLTYNISSTPGARERYPRWSPDGKWILFASDRTGEYEFYLQKSDMSGDWTQLTFGSAKFKNSPTWSPDSKKFFYTDAGNRLYVFDVETKKDSFVGYSEYSAYGDAVWSPDSKWLAYTKTDSTDFGRIYLYSLETKKETPIGDKIFSDQNPVFDAESKYLYFVSIRDFNPQFGIFELQFNMVNGQRIYGYTLSKETPSPFAPKNEMEKLPDEKPAEEKKPDEKPQELKKEEPKKEPSWDLEDMADRVFVLPLPPAGSYRLVASAPGRLLYMSGSSVNVFDFNAKRSQTIIENVGGIDVTPKMDKLAYLAGNTLGVITMQPGQQPGAGRVSTSDMDTTVDPRAEWKQSYWEAWRYERDYYWAPNMGGIDWKAIGNKYAAWLPYIGHRSDLDYLLRELLGELSTGHAYVIGAPSAPMRFVPVGLLGADYENTAAGVRFKKVFRGENWESARRAPLNEPGMNVKEGDYLIAIDGERVRPGTSVEKLLLGKADRLVEITVNSAPSEVGARKLLVRTIGDEGELRYSEWVEGRRKYVLQKTGGRVGYVHVPSTGMDGVIEFHKMFYPQVDKDGMIVDERYNSGGYIPDFFVEKLARKPLVYWTPRDMADFRSPGAAVLGPKVMLINHYGGSGGDAFPYFFKKLKVGPVIGTRTWGGLVGIFGGRDLMAGGAVTVPQFAVWDVDENGNAQWVVENIGVSPDIRVDNTPDQVWLGKDPQLDKAIEVIMEELRKNPPKRPKRPPFRGERGGG